MLKPYEMSKILVTGPKKMQENVIKELHRLKILHIIEHSKTELADIGMPLESSGKLSELMVKVRALINSLGIKKLEIDYGAVNLQEIENKANEINEMVSKNNEELRRIEELKAKNQAILNDLKHLGNIKLPLDAFRHYNSLATFTGYIHDSYDVSYLKDSLSKETEKFAVFESKLNKKVFIVLFVDINKKEYAAEVIQKVNFSPVSLSNLYNDMLDRKKNAADSIKQVELQLQKLDYAREKILKRVQKTADENKNFLLAAEELLRQELEKAEAPLRFAATKDAFLIKGWVPTLQLNATMENLNKAGKNKIFMHSQNAAKEDKVPVKLKNAKYSRPFEFFIDLYSTPTYKEIDPTFLIFLTFPLFFGFMLGDIGYGLVSFGLFWLLKKKFPKGKSLFNILLLASAVSIVFGFLYGEIFGLEDIGGFQFPHLLSRVHEITALLYIAVGIGVIHVNIGLIAGFINEMKAHGIKKAIFEKGSWFVLQIGVLMLALTYSKAINLSAIVGYGFLLISIIMLLKGEGIKGIIELPSIFTNILSYARLMAIGLSSVSLALLINESAGELFRKGGFSILIGILLLIVGHIFNIVLGLFGSFLHSLRLHYVEFFSKFFHGGAEKYKPFGLREQ